MASREQEAPMRWATLPNAISVARLLVFVPLTIWLAADGRALAATLSLAAFGATDWIDGFLARRLGQVSRVGEILDPVADRLVLITIFVCDVTLLVIGLTRLDRVREGRVNLLGKARSAFIMVAMPLHLLSYAAQVPAEPLRGITWWMLAIGTVLHVAAGAVYAVRYLRRRAP
jgi:cardiolipin synthase